MDRKHIGAHSELTACAWLLSQGFEVFRNVSAHGPVDVVGMKDGVCHLFDVKTTDGAEPALTAERGTLAVRTIVVTPDGCRIVDDPRYRQPDDSRVIPFRQPVYGSNGGKYGRMLADLGRMFGDDSAQAA